MSLLLLLLLLTLPSVTAQINGGPIIDACVFGNRQLYPGDTIPIQVLVQNSGYIESVTGYSTPSWLSQNEASFASSANYSSMSSQSEEAAYQITASGGGVNVGGNTPIGLGDIAGKSSLSDTKSSTSLSSASYKYSGVGTPGDLQINSNPSVPATVTTALGVTCRLSPGDAPIEIMSDNKMLLGSLCSGAVSAPVPYLLRVARNAKPGYYRLPLLVTYKRLAEDFDYTSVLGPTYDYNNYVEESVVIYLNIQIMDTFDLVVSQVSSTEMVPGTAGLVDVKVSNLGNLSVDDAVAYLTCPSCGPNQDSFTYSASTSTTATGQPRSIGQDMLVPVQNSQYLGHMEPGEQRTAQFKVSISDEAEEGDYPLSAVVSYTDPWNIQKSSNIDTFGSHVEPQMRFSVDTDPIEIRCGRSCIANITLINNGSIIAHDAIVRMNALDPFTVSYDTMYLGDAEPGKNISTKFGIKVKSDAVPGTYYVTLEVKYYDSQDDPHITKVIRKAIIVDPPPSLWDMIMENWPLAAGFIILLIIASAYTCYRWINNRKGRNRPPGSGDQATGSLSGQDPPEDKNT